MFADRVTKIYRNSYQLTNRTESNAQIDKFQVKKHSYYIHDNNFSTFELLSHELIHSHKNYNNNFLFRRKLHGILKN